MIRSCWLVPVAACAFATAAVAQPLRTASPSSVSPVRIQYDQVREFLDAGAPLPGPDDFEQAYASAKSTIPPPPPSRADAMAIVESEMKAIKAMQVKQRLPTWPAVRRYRCSMVQSAAFPIRWSA